MLAFPRSFVRRHRNLLIVLISALTVRAVFAVLVRDTYDYDEFVTLLLARDFARGEIPYRDFMFFHPPGILVLFRPLDPLMESWWSIGRGLSIVTDAATAGLIWSIARRLYDDRTALMAGLLYALSPLALISSVRIGQDPLITALGVLGLSALMSGPSRRRALLAGVCIGLSIWIKYPAVYFLPVYALLAPRRLVYFVGSAACSLTVLLLPFWPEMSQLHYQTITFQSTRWTMLPDVRLETTALYWLVVNAPAVVAFARFRPPSWLAAGFLMGGLFVFTSQVYYHYFVVVVPFAALLAAPLLSRHLRFVVVCGVMLAAAWAAFLDLGGSSPLYVTAARLSSIQPTIRLIDAKTASGQPVLADRYEYPYLAHRPALSHYFWNIGVLVDERYLERRLDHAGAVVMSYGASSGYPTGFTTYLDRRFRHVETPVTRVWLLSSRRSRRP